MVSDKATGDEGWLRLLCLTVSVGLHAGLIAVGWQGAEMPPADRRPLTVVLVEKTAVAPTAAPGQRPGTPVSSRRKALPAITRKASLSSVEPVVVVPEQASAGDAVEVGPGDAGDGLQSGGGAETGDGFYRPKGAAVRVADSDGSLIKATPRYETNQPPHYPRLARQNRWEGTVRLRAKVTASGVVEAVSLERSSGHAVLDRSALDGVQQWRFIAATRGGVPIACEVSLPVAFRLTEP